MITPLHELIIKIITDFLLTNDNSRFVELITQLHELIIKIITDFLITNDNSRFVELITQLHELIIEIITDFFSNERQSSVRWNDNTAPRTDYWNYQRLQ